MAAAAAIGRGSTDGFFEYKTRFGKLKEFPVFVINGTPFVMINRPFGSGKTTVDLEGYNVVILESVSGTDDVVIKANYIAVLADITSLKGNLTIVAKGRIWTFNSEIEAAGQKRITSLEFKQLKINPARLKFLRAQFGTAIEKGEEGTEDNGKFYVGTLAECYGAIQDPNDERSSDSISLPETFACFGIPTPTMAAKERDQTNSPSFNRTYNSLSK